MFNFFKASKNNEELNIEIDEKNIPQHVAIIMDGNGRWAKKRNMPRTMGHKAGVETIRRIVKEADRLGIKFITLYAFSTENWKRPKDEVSALMNLIVEYLKRELDEMHRNNVKIKSMGDLTKLPDKCRKALEDAFEKTKDNTGVVLNIALNYGGRDDIIRGVKSLVKDVQEGKLSIDDINEGMFNDYLYTKNIPDPDLIIRPSGEQRISNFLLWQCAYSEFWYSNVNWPDFSEKDLQKAIYDYQNRDRRYGGV